MHTKDDNYQRRKVTGSYFTSTISISLVLFMIGILGVMVLNAHKLSEHIRENLGFEVVMKPTVKKAEILRFQKRMDAQGYIKSTNYITAEEAARRLTEDLGEDFQNILDKEKNPLLPSVDIRFKAAWANNDSIEKIEKVLTRDFPIIKEVFYQKSLVHLVNNNLQKMSFVILGFVVVLLIIAIALINNTIRLSVYSKRFIIRSMQLVGATKRFITRPFIWKGIFQGLISSIIALLVLTALLFSLKEQFPEWEQVKDPTRIFILYGLVTIIGVFISGWSTRKAVRKYLGTKTDLLYF
ncbi:MAG: cell division protein FtsX [Bacteroidales bacterium]